MQKRSLLLQLFLSYLWIMILAVVGVGLYGSYATRQFYLGQTAADLEARARLCAKRVMELLAEGDTQAVDALCKDWGRPIQTRITVILPTGEVVGDTDEDPKKMENHRDRLEVKEAMAGKVGRATHFSRTTQEDRMYVALAVPPDGPLAAVVRTSIPVTEVNETLAAIHQKIIIAGLVGFGLMAAATLVWMWRRVSRPLEEMRLAAERFADGELSYRFPEAESEEIGELAEALNQMAERLAGRIRAAKERQEGSE